ncbi:hypothetical protein Unana1_01279 [Umbelopsis nana]
MFSRIRGIRLLTQAQQGQAQALCRCLVNSSFHRLQPAAACSIIQLSREYHPSRTLNGQIVSQVICFKRHASTHVNNNSATLENIESQLATCVDTLDLYTAIDLVEHAQKLGVAKPHHYQQMFLIFDADVKIDLSSLARIARWFTHPQGNPIPATTLEEQNVWKHAMKECFRLARSHFQPELNDLLKAFSTCTKLEQIHSADIWGVLLRGHGILKQEDVIDRMLSKLPDDVDCLESIVLAYSSAGAYEKSDLYFDKLLGLRTPQQTTVKILARTAAYEGNVDRVKDVMLKSSKLFQDIMFDQELILAYKTKLSRSMKSLYPNTSYSGRNSNVTHAEPLSEAKEVCDKLISKMLSDGYPLDLTSANTIIDFLTLGNRIDHAKFPMERARDVLENALPAKGIQPDFQSYFLILRGYAKTRELDQPWVNARLDKCLEIFYLMEKAGLESRPQAKFQCLFEACLPHSERFNCDNFYAKSFLAPTVLSTIAHHNVPHLDPRVFDIERIMLESNIRHDRITIKTLLTCLGVSGQYAAMWRRWKELQLAGIRRDSGLYQRVFALAALDPEEAQYALSVVRHQLGRETPKVEITMGIYQSIIDCCIAAQDALTAKSVLQAIGTETLPSPEDIKTHHEMQLKLLDLRTRLGIRALTGNINTHLKEMMDLRVPPKSDMWLMLMSHAVDTQFDIQDAQRVFNGFTMSRFEMTGKVPVPAHTKSPVIPFPSSPYSETDVFMIDMFVSALLKSQNIPVIRDVLEAYTEQSPDLWLSRDSVKSFFALARQEKSKDDVKWIIQNFLPRLPNQSSKYKLWVNNLQQYIDKD